VSGGLVSCVVGERQYAIRGADIREIVRAERMRTSPVPGRHDGAIGALLVGREPVPVYSLATILEGDAAPENVATSGHHIVVTAGAQGPVGWLADRTVRSHLTDRLDVLPLPAVLTTAASAWFEGLLIVEGAPLLLLSPRNLDPRATPAPSIVEVPATSVETLPTRPRDTGAALVVMFSSPALPRSGGARYALSARRIEAVVQSLAVTPVPGCPPHVTGVAVWRGHVMPVVDFRSASERSAAAEGTRFLIARCGRPLRGGSVAFAVDSELALHKPTRDDREAEETEPTPPFVAGTFIVSGDRLALLDLDALLLSPASRPTA
jgi:chemotaxis signal transduction protein